MCCPTYRGQKKEDKDKVQDFEKSNRIDMEKDKEKKKGKKDNNRGAETKKQKNKNNLLKKNIIDITV